MNFHSLRFFFTHSQPPSLTSFWKSAITIQGSLDGSLKIKGSPNGAAEQYCFIMQPVRNNDARVRLGQPKVFRVATGRRTVAGPASAGADPRPARRRSRGRSRSAKKCGRSTAAPSHQSVDRWHAGRRRSRPHSQSKKATNQQRTDSVDVVEMNPLQLLLAVLLVCRAGAEVLRPAHVAEAIAVLEALKRNQPPASDVLPTQLLLDAHGWCPRPSWQTASWRLELTTIALLSLRRDGAERCGPGRRRL